MSKNKRTFPNKATRPKILLEELNERKKNDLNWKSGRSFSYVYYAEDDILTTLKEAYTTYFSENALNPSAFPSLRNMEKEVVHMCLDLMEAKDDGVGTLTTGGTESILMAVKSAKEYCRIHKPQILEPELIVAKSVHPAFNKACDYFNIKPIIVNYTDDYRMDMDEVTSAISDQTIMIVGSAPQYPQGVVDPIRELGKIALKNDLLFHVDACVGGFLLPFLSEDKSIDFNMSIPGVTSMSADIHKYGYASKGSSVILYNRADLRKAQFYVYTDWPGGMYASPSILGTRPGGAIAVAWTVLQLIGREGYKRLVAKKLELVNSFINIVKSYPELSIVGNPDLCIFSFKSDTINIYELGDELYIKGWLLDRQQNPPSLHISVSPNHENFIDEFKHDFEEAMQIVRKGSISQIGNKAQVAASKGLKKILPKKMFGKVQKKVLEKSNPDDKRSAALYGMIGDLKGKGELDDLIRNYLDVLMR